MQKTMERQHWRILLYLGSYKNCNNKYVSRYYQKEYADILSKLRLLLQLRIISSESSENPLQSISRIKFFIPHNKIHNFIIGHQHKACYILFTFTTIPSREEIGTKTPTKRGSFLYLVDEDYVVNRPFSRRWRVHPHHCQVLLRPQTLWDPKVRQKDSSVCVHWL